MICEKETHMHVHHKYYVKQQLPWDYPDEALITLCNWCHWKLHESERVPIFSLVDGMKINQNYTPCFRCNGAGVFPEYNHVEKGICFRCRGKRYEEEIFENIISF